MKKIYLSLIAIIVLGFTAKSQTIIDITDADLEAGQTYNWTKDNVYSLEGLVFVEDGATLNIQAGTVIKFKPNLSATDPSALIICRGAKMFASGTAAEPIIFTSEVDDLSDPTDLGPTDNALWGGIVLLGKALTTKNGNTEVNIEGIPTTEPRGIYGMPSGQNVDNDNSGVMRYCSIRHGGSALTTGSELNGLSLGGVGSGTTLEYIDIYANSDDGIEFFGGTVNLKYASVAFCEDDCYDWDETYRGKGQFWFSIQRDDVADNGWECDGSTPDNAVPFSKPTVYNATHIGSGPGAAAGNATGWLLRAGTQGLICNSIVSEMKNKGIEVQDRPANTTTDAYSQLVAGELVLKNNIFYNCGSNTTMDMSSTGIIRSTVTSGLGGEDSTCTALVNHLNTNANLIQDPGFVNVSRTQSGILDPRPSQTGSAYTTALAELPVGDSFFTSVNYKGAFSSDASGLWLHGWSTLSKNGHLSTIASVKNTIENSSKISISPNPSNEIASISFQATSNVSITIFDAFGKKIESFGNISSNQNSIKVDVSKYSSGIYFVQLLDGNNLYNSKFIVK